ncbi:MAG: hypothetical protein CME36_00400 [unclassified Hahellaceae]|nr:hypothetical protein [Hahellaceae bacterium]
MRRSFHVCMHIDNALRLSDRKLSGMLSRDGLTLSAREVRLELQADRAKGHAYFCGCDNRKPDGSCAGHAVEKGGEE